jgi:TLD/Rab-GTPase-TBC domain
MVRKGVPEALRCAVWISNVIQVTHPHLEPKRWHEYRTLAKARPLDEAYEMVLQQIVPALSTSSTTTASESDAAAANFIVDDEAWDELDVPLFGHSTLVSSSSLSTLTSSNSDSSSLAHHRTIESVFPKVTSKGKRAWKKVLVAVSTVANVEVAPLIPVLCALLLQCMSESYAFCALREMVVHGAEHYLPTSRREHKATEFAFCDVLKKLHKATFEYLDDRGALDDLAVLFQNFFVTLLPIHHVQRIVDAYTLEGTKVIFRFGVALVVLYKVYAAENLLTISTADEWWNGLRHWAHSRHFDFELVVRKAYGVHGRGLRRQLRFPRRSILQRIVRIEEDRIYDQEAIDGHEAEADWARDAAGAPVRPLGLVRPDLTGEGASAADSSAHSGASSATTTTTSSGRFSSSLSRKDRDLIAVPVLAEPNTVRMHLAQWLPLRVQMSNLVLLYSTSYHGRSLDMLYRRVRNFRHTVLLAEVLPPKVTASSSSAHPTPTQDAPTVLIGMYASQVWRPSNQVYGDASCFLFRLQPDAKSWNWKPSAPKRNGASVLDASELLEQDVQEQQAGWGSNAANNRIALLEQFMVGTRTYISMGGNQDGSAGLRLNEDLTIGESSTAAGFENEPLHGVGSGNGGIFDVGLVEVYGLVRQIDGRPA